MCVADFDPLSPFVYEAHAAKLGSHSDVHHQYQYLIRVVIITFMVICKQSKCILLEITSRTVLTIISYDQNTLGGAITHNMSKPFAAVTLDVSRSA
jgi:hypothetical protein